MSDMIFLWLQGWALVSVFFVALWLLEVRDDDASLVDAGWAASLGGLAVLFAVQGSGPLERRALLGIVVGGWALRLAAHIVRRQLGAGEDDRYRDIRAAKGNGAHRFFFFFYQAQGFLAAFLSIPFLLVAHNERQAVHFFEILALVLATLAVILESVADRQLARHREDPAMRGKTFREGLWRFSRHPNYFFEWLVWVAYAVAALPAPGGWIGLVSPVVMLFLILRVTGVPPSESRALRSRGDDYRRYQDTTSVFVPWFPRKEKASC